MKRQESMVEGMSVPIRRVWVGHSAMAQALRAALAAASAASKTPM